MLYLSPLVISPIIGAVCNGLEYVMVFNGILENGQ
jgi:hypothetical protein